MGSSGITLKGVNEMRKKLENLKANVRKKVGEGFYRAGVLLMYESQKLVPIQFGFLRASKFIRSQSQGAGGAADKIPSVFLGYTSEYAIYVHENLNAAHGAAFNRKHMKEIVGTAKNKTQIGAKSKMDAAAVSAADAASDQAAGTPGP